MDSRSPNIKTVILVEDDEDVRKAIHFSLETDGFAVCSYSNAAALLRDKPIPLHMACLIVDYKLPGMDGLELIATLRGRGIALPAVLIAAHPTAGVRSRAAAAGIEVIEKPFLDTDLAATAHKLIAGAAG